jgi:hypothetical protein
MIFFFLFSRYAIVHPFAVAINLSAGVTEAYPGFLDIDIVCAPTEVPNPLKTSTMALLLKIVVS